MKCWRIKEKEESEKEAGRKCFLKNGSMFLDQLIADCNSMSNPIRMFSSDQISKATNHFDLKDLILLRLRFIIYLGGDTEGRSYVIKKFTRPVGGEEEHAYKDIVLSARVSNNNGFLKLIGCCLEFPHPLMVFEDVEYKALNIRGSLGSEDVPVSPWNVLLKITKEVATAITYLHTAFPRIIIHKDIKATNIFLDKNWKAKLTDFSLAVTLPAGKSWIKDRVSGTPGYLDSTYSSTGSIVTEYADVYSFGILMLVLLMGRRPDMDGPEFTYYILDYARDLQERGELIEFGGGSKDMRPGQKKMFLDLALRCCAMRNEDMPKMILVAKEILVTSITLRIHQNIPPSSINVAEKFAEVGGDISQISPLSLTRAMEFWRRKKEKGKARKLFLKNGSMFLKQLIADCNGMSNPIRTECSLPIKSPKPSITSIPSILSLIFHHPYAGTRKSSKADLT
ncbi:unnamed protein product [Brassica napus]|uniref:(rape) hypothetical protein n=1 Tax=Brassica napus TaxID=3708 RepID=A0A816JBX4_BRANA|nr:unnamed protein product [Brassica napus]